MKGTDVRVKSHGCTESWIVSSKNSTREGAALWGWGGEEGGKEQWQVDRRSSRWYALFMYYDIISVLGGGEARPILRYVAEQRKGALRAIGTALRAQPAQSAQGNASKFG